MDDLAKERPEALGHDDPRDSSLGEIYKQKRNGRNNGDGNLVPPADVEDVIEEAEERGR
jgi:hypothetical protein